MRGTDYADVFFEATKPSEGGAIWNAFASFLCEAKCWTVGGVYLNGLVVCRLSLVCIGDDQLTEDVNHDDRLFVFALKEPHWLPPGFGLREAKSVSPGWSISKQKYS